MSALKDQINFEVRQLPCTLAKVIGGIMAVLGFGALVIVLTRQGSPSQTALWASAISGIAGIFIFWLSSRLLAKGLNENSDSVPTYAERKRTSLIAWVLFLVFIGICILLSFVMGG